MEIYVKKSKANKTYSKSLKTGYQDSKMRSAIIAQWYEQSSVLVIELAGLQQRIDQRKHLSCHSDNGFFSAQMPLMRPKPAGERALAVIDSGPCGMDQAALYIMSTE